MTLVLFAVAGCCFSEFVGYWVHILLHSHRIEFLSRNHMIHHLVAYSPARPMRPSGGYKTSTEHRANLLGIGLEWLLPLGLVQAGVFAGLHYLRVAAAHQAVFVAFSLAWGYLMFGYMHDNMHLKHPWLESNPRVARWFLHARRLHDIHHLNLTDDGSMAFNFGICFFAFDGLFGSLREKHERFNKKGYQAALKRYAYVLTPGA